MTTPAPTSATASGTPSACDTWKQQTLEGNALFARESFALALVCYERARGIVLWHFDSWGQADDAIAALVVSYLNLADTQACLGHLREAAATLCAVHDSLLQAVGDNGQDAALRDAARRHLRETWAALADFRRQHGASAIIDASLARHSECHADNTAAYDFQSHAHAGGPALH